MQNIVKIALAIASTIVSLSPLAALGSNHSFLSNSAMSYLTKEDWQLSKAAQSNALDHCRDGKKVAWNNPETGSHGFFLPFHTSRMQGATCRNLEIVHSANLINEKSTYKFCKLHNKWKIV